ncbi:MAG: PEP-CTERM system histidine kinase PrsK [Gammaproteobacteria bacterium]|nr:PEP-CTERM system histidine kinase PrsK [Gammaproteobacteria bacterium]
MLEISDFSYGLSALSYLIFSFALMSTWRGRLGGAPLVAAILVSAAWSLLISIKVTPSPLLSIPELTMELLRNFFWVLFITRFIHSVFPAVREQVDLIRVMVWLGMLIPSGLIGLLVYFILFGEYTLFWFNNQSILFFYVLFPIIQLFFLEYIYRNAKSDLKWGIKFFCIGLALIFLYDFYLYSNALLFSEIDNTLWSARGFVNAFSVPFLAWSLYRNPKLVKENFVSRDAVFFSSASIVLGLYLITLALGGYYVQEIGGTWGEVARVTVSFFGILILVVLIASGQMRARLRVFINKHFLTYRYDYRDEWLRLIRALSLETKTNSSLEEASLRALADMQDSLGGVLWLKQMNGNYYPAQRLSVPPLEGVVEKSDSSLVKFLQTWQWVINLEEYKSDHSLYHDLKLPLWLEKIPNAWLIVPLMLQTKLHGFIVILEPRTRRQFDWEDIDILKTAGRQIAIHLSQSQSSRALAEVEQFEAFNRTSAYVVHDLKNIVSQLALLVRNSEKHRQNPVFVEDMVSTVENSVDRMNRLLAQLRGGYQHIPNKQIVDLDQVIKSVVEEKSNAEPKPKYVSSNQPMAIMADRDRLASILGHLVQNAQDATDPQGRVTVSLQRQDNSALVEIEDTGIGMDKSFMKERLFKPFDSTKGLTGMGIGAHEAKSFIEELGGAVSVSSEVGVGTKFSLHIPLQT